MKKLQNSVQSHKQSNMQIDLKNIQNKNDELLKLISDDELLFKRLGTALDETCKEGNSIGFQLVRRNDEILLLQEKLRRMQAALDQGKLR